MCVVSMIMDHYYDEWDKKYRPNQPSDPITPIIYHFPSKEEVDEFYRLLERARKYDIEHDEPDCELEEKRNKLKKLADELGVDIDFV